LKTSLEGLSECEVRTFVQDEFTPGTVANKQVKPKNYPLESNIKSGSGLPCTTISGSLLKIHDGTIASMVATIPIAPTMKLTAAEKLISETKVAATSGDLFMTGTDFVID